MHALGQDEVLLKYVSPLHTVQPWEWWALSPLHRLGAGFGDTKWLRPSAGTGNGGNKSQGPCLYAGDKASTGQEGTDNEGAGPIQAERQGQNSLRAPTD